MSDQTHLSTQPPVLTDAIEPWHDQGGRDKEFLAWIDSAAESAEFERGLILGDSPLPDARRAVSIARIAFYAGRQDGVSFAHGKGIHTWPTKERESDLAQRLARTMPGGAL